MGTPFRTSLAEDVAAALVTAFPTARIECGRPHLDSYTMNLPYINVDIESVERYSGSPTFTNYMYRVRITGRWNYPTTGNLVTEKLERANEIHDALITDSVLSDADYGTLQDTVSVETRELDGDDSRTYEVSNIYQILITGER